MRTTPWLMLCLAVLPAPLPGPHSGPFREAPLPPVRAGCERWLVTTGAAPGLAALRAAVLADDAGQVRAEIERLRQEATRRADALAAALVTGQGTLSQSTVSQNTVVHAFWLVPVCVVDLPQAGADGLARIAGVTGVHRCGEARPLWQAQSPASVPRPLPCRVDDRGQGRHRRDQQAGALLCRRRTWATMSWNSR